MPNTADQPDSDDLNADPGTGSGMPTDADDCTDSSLTGLTAAGSGVGTPSPRVVNRKLQIPRRLGRYEIESRIGQGGMGTVFAAKDLQLDRRVAIKIPHGDLQSNPELQRRFVREAQLISELRHNGLCPVYDAGQSQGVHFLCMAFVDGQPLDQIIDREHGMPEQRAVELIIRLTEAMQTAHEAGVIHRDLKPSNIMIDKSGTPVVMDFGLAQRTDIGIDERLTMEGAPVGSPAYMAPEQIQGNAELLGPAVDIYSLGAVLYEMLTGRRAFSGSFTAVLSAVLQGTFTRPSEHRPRLSLRLEKICLKMMAAATEDRYRSMQEVRRDLEAFRSSMEDVSAENGSGGGAQTEDSENVSAVGDSRRQLIEQVIANADFNQAVRLLSELIDEKDPKLKPYALWAAERLPQVRKDREVVRAGRREACETAQQLLQNYDFQSAADVLRDYPFEMRTPRMQRLLEDCEANLAEVEQLRADIELARKRGNHKVAVRLVRRLLEIKPNDVKGRRIEAALHRWKFGDLIPGWFRASGTKRTRSAKRSPVMQAVRFLPVILLIVLVAVAIREMRVRSGYGESLSELNDGTTEADLSIASARDLLTENGATLVRDSNSGGRQSLVAEWSSPFNMYRITVLGRGGLVEQFYTGEAAYELPAASGEPTALPGDLLSSSDGLSSLPPTVPAELSGQQQTDVATSPATESVQSSSGSSFGQFGQVSQYSADLLSNLSPADAFSRGSWAKTDTGILRLSSKEGGQIGIPFRLPHDYTLKMDLSVSSADAMTAVSFPVADSIAVIELDRRGSPGTPDNTFLNVPDFSGNIFRGTVLPADKTVSIEIRVTGQRPADCAVELSADGRSLVRWNGVSRALMTRDLDLMPPEGIALRCTGGGMDVSSLTVTAPQSAAADTDAGVAEYVRFSGSGSVQLPESLRYTGDNPLTLEVVFTPETMHTEQTLIGNIQQSGVALQIDERGFPKLIVHDGSVYHQVVGDRELEPGRKYHLAGVLSKPTAKLFVDGRQQSRTRSFSRHKAGIRFMIGADPDSDQPDARPQHCFEGVIHEVRLSGRARYTGSFSPPDKLSADSGTTACYRLDASEGDVLRDLSGNGYDGRMFAVRRTENARLRETVVASTGQMASREWTYTTSDVPPEWNKDDFDDSDWKKGKGGFGWNKSEFIRTIWRTEKIRIRRTFYISMAPAGAYLLIRHDDAASVWINGTMAAYLPGYTNGYRRIFLPSAVMEKLREGENCIAVECVNNNRPHEGNPGYLDVGLVVVRD